MKFRDIPQYTTTSYFLDVSLNYILEHLEDWISKDNLNLDPEFQRHHVWTTDQQSNYIEFLLKGGVTGKNFYFNHPSWMGNFKGDFVLVDGKQRLDAIQKFMNNELQAFYWYRKEFEDSLPMITVKFWVASLKTKKEVLQWYIDFNVGGVVHTDEEIDKVKSMILEIDNE